MDDDWRKTSFSGNEGNCLELFRNLAKLRDSKDPAARSLDVNLRVFVGQVKAGQITR